MDQPASRSRPGGASPSPAGASLGLARNALHLLLGQVSTTALSIVLSAALGRSLGAAEFGLYYLVTSMGTFAYIFVDWGQGNYVTREVARSPAKAPELLGGTLAFRALGSGAVCLPSVLVTRFLGYDARTQALTALLVLATLPTASAQACGFVFRGRERMDYDAVVSVVAKVLTVALTIPALLLGGGVTSVILAQAAAGLGALGVAAVLLRRLGVAFGRPTLAAARELFRGGTPMMTITLAISVQPYLDAIVLTKMAPPVAVGWYAAAKNFMGLLFAPATILASAAYPRLSKVAGDATALKREIRTTLRPLLGLGVAASVGTYLFAGTAVSVVYSHARFGPATAIVQVFAPGLLLFFVDVTLANAVLAVGDPRRLAAAKAVAVALATGLDLVLVPWCQARYGSGGIGVVLAFVLSEIAMLAAALRLVPPGTFDRRLAADLLRALAAGGGTLLAVEALPPAVPLRMAAYLVAFTALSVMLGLVSREDIALARALLSRGRAPRPTGSDGP